VAYIRKASLSQKPSNVNGRSPKVTSSSVKRAAQRCSPWRWARGKAGTLRQPFFGRVRKDKVRGCSGCA